VSELLAVDILLRTISDGVAVIVSINIGDGTIVGKAAATTGVVVAVSTGAEDTTLQAITKAKRGIT